jgi:MFS family permease
VSGRATRVRAELAAFPRQFWLLAASIFVLLTGVDMCFPLETIYLTKHLHVSATTVGLVLGVPILATLPLHIVGGAFTDRYGRRPAMAIGIAVVTALYLTFALSSTLWPIAIAITIEAAFGWALFLTGSNAMIADLVVHERRTEAYGFTRVALNLGMVAGPWLAGILTTADPTFRTMFLSGAGVTGVFVVIVVLRFRETLPQVKAKDRESPLETLKGYGVVLRDGRYVAFCLISLLPLYGFGQIWSILPVALQTEFGIPTGTWSHLLMTYALAGAIMQYPVVRYVRHRDHFVWMSVSAACMGAGLGGTILAPWGAATYVSMIVLSFGVVLLIPISMTIAAELAPVELRGRYMGAWTLVQMGGYALGPTFGGMAIDRLGVRSAFVLIVALGLAGATLFAITAPWFRRGVKPPDAGGAVRDDTDEDPLPAVPPAV